MKHITSLTKHCMNKIGKNELIPPNCTGPMFQKLLAKVKGYSYILKDEADFLTSKYTVYFFKKKLMSVYCFEIYSN